MGKLEGVGAVVVGATATAAAGALLAGAGALLMVKDLTEYSLGSTEAKLLPALRQIVLTRYDLALNGVPIESCFPKKE